MENDVIGRFDGGREHKQSATEAEDRACVGEVVCMMRIDLKADVSTIRRYS